MPETFASAVIPADAATVWHSLRDFGGLTDWQPAVARRTLHDEDSPDRDHRQEAHLAAGPEEQHLRPLPRAANAPVPARVRSRDADKAAAAQARTRCPGPGSGRAAPAWFPV
jgi:hypothetical protein